MSPTEGGGKFWCFNSEPSSPLGRFPESPTPLAIAPCPSPPGPPSSTPLEHIVADADFTLSTARPGTLTRTLTRILTRTPTRILTRTETRMTEDAVRAAHAAAERESGLLDRIHTLEEKLEASKAREEQLERDVDFHKRAWEGASSRVESLAASIVARRRAGNRKTFGWRKDIFAK